MNNSGLPNTSSDGQYHATYNLNTAMENPHADFNDAMDVNTASNTNVNLDSSDSGSFQNDFQEQTFQNNVEDSSYQADANAYQDNSFNAREFTNLNNSNEVLMNDNLNQVDNYQSNDFQNEELNGDNTFIPNVEQSNTVVGATQEYDTSSYSSEVTYAPVMEKKEAPNNKIKVSLSKEITYMFVIVLVLVLFLLLMPYVYDFFRNLSFGLIR